MTFIWPAMLFSLVLIPLFIGVYLLMQQRRRKLTANYSSLGFGSGGKGNQPGPRRHIPVAFFLMGLTILAIALARPQAVVALPKQEGTVILAFDVSGSMAADDIKPTRMQAAQAAARDFVKHQPLFVQTGVVAFSDTGLSVQVPTNDPGAVLAAINRLAPQSGTSVGQGILASLKIIATGASGGLPGEVYSNLLHTEHILRPSSSCCRMAKIMKTPTRWLPPRRLLTGVYASIPLALAAQPGPLCISTVFPCIRNLMKQPCNKYPRSAVALITMPRAHRTCSRYMITSTRN
jgi:hypothetical protein